jgi:hypothetical protein
MESKFKRIPAVISVYNDDPNYLASIFSELWIYDNSDQQNSLGEKLLSQFASRDKIVYVKAKNPGHSLANFLSFICENYQNLPSRFALLKSNVVPRHVSTLEELLSLLGVSGTVPLWFDSAFKSTGFQETRLTPNFYLERNNSWFLASGSEEYFSSFESFLDFLFEKPIKREWIPFAPGACYVTTKDDCLRRPKAFWEFLNFISSYKFFPPEAYLVERVLYLALTSPEATNPRFLAGDWQSDLSQIVLSRKGQSLRAKVKSAVLDLAHRI